MDFLYVSRPPYLVLPFSDLTRFFAGANITLLPSLGAWFRPLTGKAQYTKGGVDSAKAAVLKNAAYLEATLADKTFLVGNRITLADIFVASVLARGFEFVRLPLPFRPALEPHPDPPISPPFENEPHQVLDADFRKSHPNTFRFYNTIVNQPQFVAVAADLPVIEKAIVYTPPKKEPAAPKAAPAPAAPKAPKAPKAKDDDEEEPSVPDEPKAKHPAELLGPAKSFPLDEFKRQYSNNDTAIALKWLEDNYDAQDYSLWKVDYKYPEELTKGPFLSLLRSKSRLIRAVSNPGSFHVLQPHRWIPLSPRGLPEIPFRFRRCLRRGEQQQDRWCLPHPWRWCVFLSPPPPFLFFTAEPNAHAGLLAFTDHRSVFDVAPDWESYSYTPLDFKADREFIEGAWAWTNEVDGLKYADGKVFKCVSSLSLPSILLSQMLMVSPSSLR